MIIETRKRKMKEQNPEDKNKVKVELENNCAVIWINGSYNFVDFRTWGTVTIKDIEKVYLKIKELGLIRRGNKDD